MTAQGRDYRAADLRAGDRVEVELREGADMRLYADQVHVIGSGGVSAATAIRNIEGTVERVSLARSVIELRSRSGQLLTSMCRTLQVRKPGIAFIGFGSATMFVSKANS